MENSDAVQEDAKVNGGAALVFALIFFAFALFLLSQMNNETNWVNGRPWSKQPGMWSVMAVAGMVFFGGLETIAAWRRRRATASTPVLPELVLWLSAVEYTFWFMAYVWAVPQIGYLLATLIFCTALTWRLGYRSWKPLLSAAVLGLVVIVIFKSFLSVKIPGGAVYEMLPDALRNFMILYL